jgi:hypothetical protein
MRLIRVTSKIHFYNCCKFFLATNITNKSADSKTNCFTSCLHHYIRTWPGSLYLIKYSRGISTSRLLSGTNGSDICISVSITTYTQCVQILLGLCSLKIQDVNYFQNFTLFIQNSLLLNQYIAGINWKVFKNSHCTPFVESHLKLRYIPFGCPGYCHDGLLSSPT